MAIKVTFAHYKGGTGKTTSCVSVAGWLAKTGNRVLVVDLDPQGNATSGLGIDKTSINKSMYEVMDNRTDIKNIILDTEIENLHLAPTTNELDLITSKSYSEKEDAQILSRALKSIDHYYDFILIDTPPIHLHFIINGMAAADKVILVLDPGVFALEGFSILNNSFTSLFKQLGLNLNIAMALITKSPRFSFFRRNQAKIIKKEIEKIFDKRILLIPYSDDIFYTQAEGIPISHMKPRSRVSKAYQEVAEFLAEESKEGKWWK